MVWHSRLGHPSHAVLAKVLSSIDPSIKCNKFNFCDACKIGKMHQFSFKPSNNNTSAPFEIVYIDVWGPSFHTSNDGFKYYLSFVDDYTKYVWLYPMTVKSEVQSCFKQFLSYVERFFYAKIKCVQMDL